MLAIATAGCNVNEPSSALIQASAVAIAGRALIIEGPPGSGKSSLALALIDRGAMLIGDDGVALSREGETVFASPPPNIAGLLEIRGVGLVDLALAPLTPVALILSLSAQAQRLPDSIEQREILSVSIPILPFDPGTIAPAARAEWALRQHGLAL
jgi:serine kinase of HPr protein (carbohydrate metabolism regulator)